MKTRTTFIAICAAAALMSGCTDHQMVGTMAGSTMGGIFGSSIGGLMGGPRGSDAGTAIGMLAGGVIGNAVASASESRTYDEYEAPRRKSKHGRHGRPHRYSEPPRTTHAPARIEGLSVENIRFIDDNRNQRLDAGEKAKILFEIHNRGNATLYNIAPVIKCYNVKRIAISPTAIISNLRPGKGVSYTAAIAVSPRVKDGYAIFTLSFQDGNSIIEYKTFQIPTQGR